MIPPTWPLLGLWLRMNHNMNQQCRWKRLAQDPLEHLVSRPPQKAQRDEQWTPSTTRGVPMSIQQATALMGRETQRASAPKATGSPAPSDDAAPIQRAVQWALLEEYDSSFSVDDDSSLRPSGGRKGKRASSLGKGKGKPIKAKEKGTKERESKEMAEHREERATVHVAQLYVASSRPSHQRSDAWCLRIADPVDSA